MKKAIVVGASSGIGKALAIILSKNQYKVGITGRRAANLFEIKNGNPTAFITKSFDCTDDNCTINLEELATQLEGLDVLVLSSGIGHTNKGFTYALEKETVDLNVTAFTQMVNFAYHYFKKQGHGHLVVISSIAGIRGGRHGMAYNASKGYQINYLEGLRQKIHHENLPIKITDIRPGFVDTAMAQGPGMFWVATKEKAAQQIYSAIKRQKNIVYVTKRWRLIALLLKILPKRIYKRL